VAVGGAAGIVGGMTTGALIAAASGPAAPGVFFGAALWGGIAGAITGLSAATPEHAGVGGAVAGLGQPLMNAAIKKAGAAIAKTLFGKQLGTLQPIVQEIAEELVIWIGEGFVVKRFDGRGFVALSKDGQRRFRIDFDGHGSSPHAHLEVWSASRRRWVDAIRGRHRLPFRQ
jgi:hypothetical protein